MGRVVTAAYTPDPARADAYSRLYVEYRQLHDHFSARGGTTSEVLHRMRRIRNEALGEA